MTNEKRLSQFERAYYVGVLAALLLVDRSGQETLYKEIVYAVGQDNLIAVARRSGQMRISGLSKYLKQNRDYALGAVCPTKKREVGCELK